MKEINRLFLFCLLVLGLYSCHKSPQYIGTQNRFAYDPSYRIGKWYSISDVGITLPTYNARLDTIWFINDTLAGWTGFRSDQHQYVFWKTYLDPQSIYNIIYLAPGNPDTTKTDTVKHQFGFTATGDTMTIFWDDWTTPPQTERYLKKKN